MEHRRLFSYSNSQSDQIDQSSFACGLSMESGTARTKSNYRETDLPETSMLDVDLDIDYSTFSSMDTKAQHIG